MFVIVNQIVKICVEEEKYKAIKTAYKLISGIKILLEISQNDYDKMIFPLKEVL